MYVEVSPLKCHQSNFMFKIRRKMCFLARWQAGKTAGYAPSSNLQAREPVLYASWASGPYHGRFWVPLSPWLLVCLHRLPTHQKGISPVCWEYIVPGDSDLLSCLNIRVLLVGDRDDLCCYLFCCLHVWPAHQDTDHQLALEWFLLNPCSDHPLTDHLHCGLWCLLREETAPKSQWEVLSLCAAWLFDYDAYITFPFPDSSVGKESACNAGDPGSIPG